MSDERLRALERRYQETGSADDELAWLRERLRAGDLERERLELAAYLGSPGARALMGEDPPARTRAPKTGIKGWVRKLEPWGALPCLRAAIAATRLLVRDEDDPAEHASLLRTLHLAEAYALDPREEVLRAQRALPDPPRDFRQLLPRWRACYHCGGILGLLHASNHFAWQARHAAEAVAEAVGSEARVRRAMSAELLSWTLGLGDPVAERFAARPPLDLGSASPW